MSRERSYFNFLLTSLRATDTGASSVNPLERNILLEIFFFPRRRPISVWLQDLPRIKTKRGEEQNTVSSRLKWSYVAINYKLAFVIGRSGASTQPCLSRSRTAIQLKRHFYRTRSTFPSLPLLIFYETLLYSLFFFPFKRDWENKIVRFRTFSRETQVWSELMIRFHILQRLAGAEGKWWNRGK